MILDGIHSVLSILLMIAVGFVAARARWFDDKTAGLFSRVVVNISLPALLFTNIVTSFTREQLLGNALGFVLPFTVIAVSYVLGALLATVLRAPRASRGVFQALFGFSNTIFIGLPVSIALFGEASIPYVSMYYVANTSLFWTVGVHFIRRDGGETTGHLFTVENLRRILSPPFLAFLLGITCVLLGLDLRPAKFLLDSGKYIGALTTPLSMFFTGIVLYSTGWEGMRFDLRMPAILLGRFVITPALAVWLLGLVSLPLLMKQVFVVETALPVMAQVAIVAESYRADHRFAAAMITLTTLASLVTIPLLMVAMSCWLHG